PPTAGWSATARSPSASSPTATTACESPNPPAVDLWTTLRVAHRVHRFGSPNRPERNENCVTHVVGQTCHLCSRLLTRGRTPNRAGARGGRTGPAEDRGRRCA